MFIQWNLQITDTLGPANFGVILLLKRVRGKIVLPWSSRDRPQNLLFIGRLNVLCPIFRVSFKRGSTVKGVLH